jgi:DNA-nicking Smr family endonuclease
MNKYARTPTLILDLHGHTTREAKEILDELLAKNEHSHIRIITGKGTYRETGPVLRSYVQRYLSDHDITFETAKLFDGGDGALEVFLR